MVAVIGIPLMGGLRLATGALQLLISPHQALNL
jgi:hypothetical protein